MMLNRIAGRIFLAAMGLAHASELTVAAAADLSSLEPGLVKLFEQQTGISVAVTLGASGILRQQIENGAPYDVFLSANEQYVRGLASAGLIDPASVRIYAEGRLGLWSRDGRFRSVGDLRQTNLRQLAIADPAGGWDREGDSGSRRGPAFRGFFVQRAWAEAAA